MWFTLRSCKGSHGLPSTVSHVGRRYFYYGRQPKPPQRPLMDEYTEKPEYPKIYDPSFRSRKLRDAEKWHQEIRNARTVEEKMIKINMPRYYGYKVVELGNARLPYNCLPAIQHYTRTMFTETALIGGESERRVESEPQRTEDVQNKIEQSEENAELLDQKKRDALVQALKGDVQDALEFANDYFENKYKDVQLDPIDRERKFSQLIVEQVNRSLINTLAADYIYLKDVEVDYNPRHEAFWFVGGIDPPKNVVRSKEGHKWQKEMANDPIDRAMQYVGEPYLAIRHRQQLPAWAATDNSVNLEELPLYKHDPRTLGYLTGYCHGTNIPGFWPGSPHPFGCISFQSRVHMNIRPASYGPEDFKEALQAHAIQSSFAWLLAQANYFGFNTFSELTYPMNTQTIITNGRDWSFYEYQLNTLLMHSHHVSDNPKVNYCRGTPELQLYQEFDDNGKCIGLNDVVLHQLVRFYTNEPSVNRTPAELTPYLQDPNVQRCADYENDEQRVFLENAFKRMVSNRPRHLEIPEIYLWEKIYKIDNKTRPLDAKRRFFELGINPWKRTLDQHDREYVPKALRPDVPKNKNRFKKTYYP